jgi:peptide/nickel transport system substrate-binding protein
VSWVCYDRLMTYGKKKLPDGRVIYDRNKLEPELAESWKIAPDGNSVTFKLRKNAKFHDGTPVTAKDVKWSFDRAVTVGGFPTFQMAAGSLEKPEQFEVVDDHTFRVKFLRRDKLTMNDLAVPVPCIFNSELVKKNATAQDPWGLAWTRNNTAGGGAYKVEAFRPGRRSSTCATTTGRAARCRSCAASSSATCPTPATAARCCSRATSTSPSTCRRRTSPNWPRKAPPSRWQTMPIENAMFYLGMNVTKPPFDNPKVRQAVAWALPYDKMNDNALYGRASSSTAASSQGQAPPGRRPPATRPTSPRPRR